MYTSLGEFICRLEREGELLRIKTRVSSDLEIAEITDRMAKTKGGGKALLFENTDREFPVLTNMMGSDRRMAMALGGGLNMFFLVATMLGLFGSPVLPSIIRMEALNAFNYVSIISLFDVVSILDGTTTFIWKWAILLAVGIICYIVGSLKFEKKDLPL